MKSKFTIMSLLVLMAMFSLTIHPIAAQTENVSKHTATVTSDADFDKLLTLWSADRIASAKLLEFPTVTDVTKVPVMPDAGKEATFEGSQPDPKVETLARSLYPEAWKASTTDDKQEFSEKELNGLPYSWGYVNANGPVTAYPYSTIGRLFFTTATGHASSCSASVIARRGIVTAAHCVFTRGQGWHRSFLFIPSYRVGMSCSSAPYGCFGWTQAWTLSSWSSGNTRYNDVAVIAVADRYGYPINAWVGNMGLRWNASPTQSIASFGYPSNLGGGNYLVRCRGNSARHLTSGTRTLSIKMGCNMAYGSSGGPWTVGNYVNSVVSGPTTTATNPEFQGPFFDGGNIGVLWGIIGNR